MISWAFMRGMVLGDLDGPDWIMSGVFRADPSVPEEVLLPGSFGVCPPWQSALLCETGFRKNTPGRMYMCVCIYTVYWLYKDIYIYTSCWYNSNSSPKAWDPGQLMLQFKSKGRRKPKVCQFKGSQAERSLPYTQEGQAFGSITLQLLGWGSPTSRKRICFTQSPVSNVNPFKNILREIPRITIHQISGYPMAQINWHKMNHHILISNLSSQPLPLYKPVSCNISLTVSLQVLFLWLNPDWYTEQAEKRIMMMIIVIFSQKPPTAGLDIVSLWQTLWEQKSWQYLPWLLRDSSSKDRTLPKTPAWVASSPPTSHLPASQTTRLASVVAKRTEEPVHSPNTHLY